ncbi:hypothetical protein R1sor_026359 [Riccia sorocarpa]|uniref:Uncharacterized protein n=1 Tax=Riccia sorocarpa TaxID=122646 RepID=A0ABD3GCT3_9MARC
MQLKADPTSSHYWEDNALIQYWTNVSDVFQAGWPSEENQPLQESFWPSTNHGTGYSLGGPSIENLALVLHHGEAEEELRARDEIFVGAASTRKLANFVPMIDIANGLMLLIRPSDDFECQDCLWVGKATGAVCQVGADTNFNKVPIQWWRPKHASSKASISDRYSQCIQRNVAWEVDPAYNGSHWIMADACVYAWKSRATKDKVSLPKTVQEIALSVLDRMSPGSEGPGCDGNGESDPESVASPWSLSKGISFSSSLVSAGTMTGILGGGGVVTCDSRLRLPESVLDSRDNLAFSAAILEPRSFSLGACVGAEGFFFGASWTTVLPLSLPDLADWQPWLQPFFLVRVSD